MVKRKILADLLAWKAKKNRKPLILTGARQVGKTYALKAFGKAEYPRLHYLNFEEEPQLATIFEKDLKPHRLIQELSFHLNSSINVGEDLLVFDEIQSAPQALTSLKYFAEELPRLSLCAAGSLLGLQLAERSFPVGKVDFLDLHPLAFEEFLSGIGDHKSVRFLESYDFQKPLPALVHEHLWGMLKIYFAVGGLPEVVSTYAALKDDPFQAMEAVRKKQQDLINAYLADVAKHSGKINSMHIERVWRNVPAQLAKPMDGTAPKFGFQGVVPGVNGYARLAGAIDWLRTAGLILKFPIANKAWLPLMAYTQENLFKLYAFDIGLLGAIGGLTPKVLLDFSFGSFKGYVAENFVLQEMTTTGKGNRVAWRENTAEVEFLWEIQGTIMPIEVKSGWITQAKSLKVFAEKYHPELQVTLSAKNFSVDRAKGKFHIPLYLAARLPQLL